MGKGAQKDGGQTPLKERMESRFAKIIEVRHDFDKASMMIIPGSERTIKPPSSQPTTPLAGQRGFSLFHKISFWWIWLMIPTLVQSARRGRQVYRETTAAISLSSMEALLMGIVIKIVTFLPHGYFQWSIVIEICDIFFFFISGMCIPNFFYFRHVHSKNFEHSKPFVHFKLFFITGMCIPNFYKPLIFSRQSHSQESATQRWFQMFIVSSYFPFSRYLDTASLLYSWYSSYCWGGIAF